MNARGYLFPTTVAYLKKALGEEATNQALATASPELQKVLQTAKEVAWYPISLNAELNRIVANAIGRGDEDLTREGMIGLGKFMAHEATNTFLRLFIRVLTPALFAKKLPDLFRRDFESGHLEVDVTDRVLTLKFSKMEGMDHVICTAVGFVTFAVETMGKQITKKTIHGWSLATPAPATGSLELEWA